MLSVCWRPPVITGRLRTAFTGLGCHLSEDESRIRSGDSPQNMAVFRHLALNILKQDAPQLSLKQKRFRAGLDEAFLLQLLTQI